MTAFLMRPILQPLMRKALDKGGFDQADTFLIDDGGAYIDDDGNEFLTTNTHGA